MTGQDNLSYLYRGFHRKATTAGDVDYAQSDCVFCGQCVALCPTENLTEKPWLARVAVGKSNGSGLLVPSAVLVVILTWRLKMVR